MSKSQAALMVSASARSYHVVNAVSEPAPIEIPGGPAQVRAER